MQKVQYDSNITREQFAKILPILESARKHTKPRKIDLYDAFCAVLYVLKTGCQWRLLPKDFPKWRSVHHYFQVWSENKPRKSSILEKILQKLVEETRLKDKRNAKTSFAIMDAQSVKNTDTAGQKGYDAGKKVSGIKRHIAVDTNGLPHGIYVSTADVTDRDGGIAMVKKNKKN
jgi:transposase